MESAKAKDILDRITGKATPAPNPVFSFKPPRPNPVPPAPGTPSPKKLTMTRAVRRQLYTAEIVFASVNCIQCDGGQVPRKTRAVVERILSRVAEIRTEIYGGEKFILSRRDMKKHARIIDAMQRVLADAISGDRFEQDLINALLLLVENTRQASRKSSNSELKKHWNLLNGSLFTLHNHLTESDPEPGPNRDGTWPGYKYQQLGAALGKKIEKEIMQ
jgi:hypothetical protein